MPTFSLAGYKELGEKDKMAAAASQEMILLGVSLPVPIAVAIIAGAVSAFVAALNWLALGSSNRAKLKADRAVTERRIEADLDLAIRQLRAEQESVSGSRAWADLKLRRNVYIELIERIEALFVGGSPELKAEFLRTARKVRLVGSDAVVLALNGLTDVIKSGAGSGESELRYRALYLTLRQDLRQVHSVPPATTDLDESAFPIES